MIDWREVVELAKEAAVKPELLPILADALEELGDCRHQSIRLHLTCGCYRAVNVAKIIAQYKTLSKEHFPVPNELWHGWEPFSHSAHWTPK